MCVLLVFIHKTTAIEHVQRRNTNPRTTDEYKRNISFCYSSGAQSVCESVRACTCKCADYVCERVFFFRHWQRRLWRRLGRTTSNIKLQLNVDRWWSSHKRETSNTRKKKKTDSSNNCTAPVAFNTKSTNKSLQTVNVIGSIARFWIRSPVFDIILNTVRRLGFRFCGFCFFFLFFLMNKTTEYIAKS